MASEKKVILIFTPWNGAGLGSAGSPALAKLVQKGALFTSVKAEGDAKTLAACGAKAGQPLWEAAAAQGLTVAGLDQPFDMCVLDAGADATAVESIVAQALEAADRSTLIVLAAAGALVFYGPGIAKGTVVAEETCACCVAPTVAYVADFPVPEQCRGPIAYQALKDVNYKLTEIKKLRESIVNMEAALERKSRQPWDKHDCA